MTVLVGRTDSAAFNGTFDVNDNTIAYFNTNVSDSTPAGKVAVADGVAGKLGININNWGTVAHIKAVIYDAAKNIIESVIIPASIGTGPQLVNLSNTNNIVSGQPYYYDFYVETSSTLTVNVATGGSFLGYKSGGSYASPVASIGNVGGYLGSLNTEIQWWIETSAGGGGGDTTPNAFTFTDQTGVALSTVITSAAITVAGIDTAAAITVTGGSYEKNNSGTFVTTAGTVVNGDTIKARHTSSAVNSTAVNTIVTIGGVSDTFTSTTLAASGANKGIRLTDIYAPNSASLVADAAGVTVVVYDTVGGTELYQGTVSIAAGDADIDSDLVGAIGATAFVILRWAVGSDELIYAGTETVIDLAA